MGHCVEVALNIPMKVVGWAAQVQPEAAPAFYICMNPFDKEIEKKKDRLSLLSYNKGNLKFILRKQKQKWNYTSVAHG